LDLLGRSNVATAPAFAKGFAGDQRPGTGGPRRMTTAVSA
jgi:hypothetical protein